MNEQTLKSAVAEAKRFLKAAKTVQAAWAQTEDAYCSPKESGAVRRASMDLTRALADLRRPG